MPVAGQPLKYLVAAAVAYAAYLVSYRGLLFGLPLPVLGVVVFCAAVALLPPFRTFCTPSLLLLGFAFLFTIAAHVVMTAPIRWWPVRQLGFGSFIWIPAAIISLVAEALVPISKVRLWRPSSAVAAAVFMAEASLGNDTSTPYDRMLPRIVVSLLIAFSPLIPIRKLWFVVAYAYAVLEPVLVVILGWIASGGGVSGAWDLKWLLPFYAAPPALAALLFSWRGAPRRLAVT